MTRRPLAVALALVCALAATSAHARHHKAATPAASFNIVTLFCGDRACPIFAAPAKSAKRASVRRGAGKARPRGNTIEFSLARPPAAKIAPALTDTRPTPSLGERTITGYANQPTPAIPAGVAARRGMVTVSTAAGINITCSPSFASAAAALIADAVVHGIRFSRITCYSRARTHVSESNHFTGDAFDSRPSIPSRLVRQHGLRSGCDFRDCPHVDNARNVGGVAFWNSVKHNGQRTTKTATARQQHRNVRVARR